jgi:integrase
VMAGVDIRTVQVLMGHKTIQMTMRYSHLSQSHLLEAVNKVGTNLAQFETKPFDNTLSYVES